MTHPNELTRTPSNNTPKRFYMGAHMIEMKGQGRDRKTSYMNVHKPNLEAQLRIFDTGTFALARPRPNDPPERVDMDALKRLDLTILHGGPHDRNKVTRESRANMLHEGAQSQPQVRT